MLRGEIWWASLPPPVGSGPGDVRPVLVIQSDAFNASRIKTVIVAVITSNLNLAKAPGNVLVSVTASNLPQDSVVNVSQVITVDKGLLRDYVGLLPNEVMEKVEIGLKLVLALD